MNFKDTLFQAKARNEQAIITLLEMYQPLLSKTSIIQGRYDEDLYQELCITLLRCIEKFRL